jgi:nucleoside 2-deoxyribosyltransferase
MAKKKYDVYIAAPFFNDRQVEVVQQILEAVENAHGMTAFCPWRDSAIPSKADKKDREKAFGMNVKGVKDSAVVLACLEYRQESPNHELRAVERGRSSNMGFYVSPELHIPDTGVVFEMGVATVCATPVVGFGHAEPRKLNLMLAESCQGFLWGFEALGKFLGTWDEEDGFDYGVLSKWTRPII